MESLRSKRREEKAEDDHTQRQKFEHIVRLLESSNPYISLHKEKIEEHLSKLTHTPDHPPYASMIQRAIKELNEQGGSSEETISKFIEAEYEDLPIAHATQLRHHLQKLVTKGEIFTTSVNCYVLSFENSDMLHKLKKGHKRRWRRNRQNRRQHKFKVVHSKEEKKNEETQKQNQVLGKVFKGIEEEKRAEEQQIGSVGQHKKQGHIEIIEEQNEVQEVRLKVIEEQYEAEQDREGKEEHVQMREQQNQQHKELNLQKGQVLGEQINVIVEENYQAERSNQAEKNSEVTEAEHQKEQEDQVIEELCHKEQERKKLEKKNQIKNQESEVRDEQAQLPDLQIEETVAQINSERQHFGMNKEQKRLDVQTMEVYCQIIDLSNMLLQFLRKENKSPMSTQNNESQMVDHFGSSHLTKEEFMELLKMTNKVEGTLNDIISSFNLEVSENNSSLSKMGGQHELLEEHLLQTQNPCTGSETVPVCGFQSNPQQQLEICSQVKVAEYQQKTISASVNLPTDSMQLEQNHKMDLPNQKRSPEVETTLEELFEKQNKQIKICDQQEAPKSESKLIKIYTELPFDSLHVGNDTAQLVIQRIETVLEDDSLATEPNIKLRGEAAVSGPETESAYLDVFMDSGKLQNSEICAQEKLPESQLVTSSLCVPMELQELDLELQRQTTSHNKEERAECKQPENQCEERHVEQEVMAVELISETHQQMVEQGQQTQLPLLGQTPSVSKVDTATSVAKRCDQTEQMQKQLQPRQLQRRVQRPSESEPVLTTVEADRDMTLTVLKSEPKKKPQPSVPKRPQEQQSNRHGQNKRLKTQPTTINHDSIITSRQQSNRRLRQRELQGQVSSLSGSLVQKIIEKSLPLKNQQHGQKQPQLRRQGRPPKLKSDVETAVGASSVAIDHQHHQQQSQRRGRGRPPKPKVNEDATVEGSLQSNHQNLNVEKPQHPRQGSPKSKLAAIMDASLPPQHQKQRPQAQGLVLPKSTSATANEIGIDKLLLSQLKQHQQHQPHCLGIGTTTRAREAAASALEASLASQRKGRGRHQQGD